MAIPAATATTGQSNAAMRLYGSLLAVFDRLDDEQRLDLIELDSAWAEASPEDRRLLLQIARRFTVR